MLSLNSSSDEDDFVTNQDAAMPLMGRASWAPRVPGTEYATAGRIAKRVIIDNNQSPATGQLELNLYLWRDGKMLHLVRGCTSHESPVHNRPIFHPVFRLAPAWVRLYASLECVNELSYGPGHPSGQWNFVVRLDGRNEHQVPRQKERLSSDHSPIPRGAYHVRQVSTLLRLVAAPAATRLWV